MAKRKKKASKADIEAKAQALYDKASEAHATPVLWAHTADTTKAKFRAKAVAELGQPEEDEEEPEEE